MSENRQLTKVAITGGDGFLGWHLACRLRALMGGEPRMVRHTELNDPIALSRALAGVELVYHLAGVNRAQHDDVVELGNVEIARRLTNALGGRPVHVVYANTIHQSTDTPYGRGKRRAAELLRALPGTLADVRLPNLFGEHGRPEYNSFVATFCHELANGRRPTISNDRLMPLLHSQAAAQVLMDAGSRCENHVNNPVGDDHLVSEVLALLNDFHRAYGIGGEIPDISTDFRTNLFNTYRSYLTPDRARMNPQGHADKRGTLFEAVRSHGGGGQIYVSTTVPGATRGEHYHLRKVERFFVVEGEAEIRLRRLLHNDVVTFRVSGSRPAVVDMPTLWVHNIRNVGEDDVLTLFWSDQLFDPAEPDQFPERVEEDLP